MTKHPVTTLLASLLVCLACAGVLAQDNINYALDDSWGEPPGGAWDGNTSWITADGKGQVYVLVRTKPYVRIFNRDGRFLRAWSGAVDIGSAHSITIDDAGNAWISDSARHVVRKYDTAGKLLMTLGVEDESGDNADRQHFNQPNYVYVAANGDLYVSDGYVNSRIVHFTRDGKLIRIIGGEKGEGPGQFKAVHGVALDSRGRILTNDSENFRVNVFNPDGSFLESWPYPSRGGIEVMADDTVYISDVNEGVVSIVKDGKLLDRAYAPRAHGLGVDADGTIYTSGASRETVMRLTHK